DYRCISSSNQKSIFSGSSYGGGNLYRCKFRNNNHISGYYNAINV
ncbi:hypothetical protein, partial [uncultured Gammaproteobacteria bacterium]